MKITLKNIEHCRGLSRETTAYTADVYINDHYAFQALNEGGGGCDEYNPVGWSAAGPKPDADQCAAELKAAHEYAKTQYTDLGNLEDMALELLIGTMVSTAIEKKAKTITRPAIQPEQGDILIFEL